MKRLPRLNPIAFYSSLALALLAFPQSTKKDSRLTHSVNAEPKIQVAVLLDVSNSMDGLISQAKAQLWNMVTVMTKAKCNDKSPEFEIALYEYGSPRNSVKDGYVKQITGFTSDLDLLSNNLFGLTTNGGDEYCGHVIYTSLQNLNWDSSASNYKVIFIAGNEDFLQGDISFTRACELAKKKGVIVNTIYCGPRQQGFAEHWNLGTECGTGSFSNIDQDAREEDIPTPYDSTLLVLNSQLNNTYLYYGLRGKEKYEYQNLADVNNTKLGKQATAKRIGVKGNNKAYLNSTWDVIDASTLDSNFIAKVDINTLPDSLKNKTREELQTIVKEKTKQRNYVQVQIANTSILRDKFIAAEKLKANINSPATLETEVEKIIREQARRFNMIIK